MMEDRLFNALILSKINAHPNQDYKQNTRI